MYEELVKRLRERSVFLFPHHGESRSYDADLIHEAADAIEELSKQMELEYQSGFADGQIAANRKKSRWIPVAKRLPNEFVSVQAHMTDAGQFPSVREAYLAGGKWYFPALNEYHPVDKWAEFSEPLKEDKT